MMRPQPPAPLVLSSHAFEGPSRHFPRRAVLARLDRAALDTRFAGHETMTPRTAARLRHVLLAGIRRLHTASFSPGFEELLQPGQPLRVMRLLASLCVEVQHLNEERVEGWQVVKSGPGKPDSILFACETDEVGHCAVPAACEILIGAVTTPVDQWSARGAMALPHASHFRIVASIHALNLGMKMISDAAGRAGVTTIRSADGRPQVQFGEGRHQHHNNNIITDSTPEIGLRIAGSKLLTSLMLERLGLPVPENALASSAEETVAAARRIGFPVVVKPENGAQGRGVTVGVSGDEEARAAFEAARRYGRDVLVERFVAGQDHRMLVVGGRLVAVAQRVAAHVVGDGASSIAQLINERNKEPYRRPKGFHMRVQISVDSEVHRVLAAEGLTMQSVPAQGRTVRLRRTANLSTGGDALDVLDQVHPENRAMAELIARLTRLDIVGIDFLTPDISVPFQAIPCAINEINTQPGLDPHGMPDDLSERVSDAILAMVIPNGPPPAMPIALVYGEEDATAAARCLHDALLARGRQPARATQEGLVVGDVTVERTPLHGDRAAARMLRHHPRADCGILTINARALHDQGVGLDHWDALILTGPATKARLGDAAALADAVNCPIFAHPAFVGAGSPLPRDRLILLDDGSPDAAGHTRNGGRLLAFRNGSNRDVADAVADLFDA
jgi:cyanophycin synthetase